MSTGGEPEWAWCAAEALSFVETKKLDKGACCGATSATELMGAAPIEPPTKDNGSKRIRAKRKDYQP